jgi:hypothetical protein
MTACAARLIFCVGRSDNPLRLITAPMVRDASHPAGKGDSRKAHPSLVTPDASPYSGGSVASAKRRGIFTGIRGFQAVIIDFWQPNR